MPPALDELQKLWRRRLGSLRAVYWEPLLAESSGVAMWNCTPVGLKGAKGAGALYCQKAHLCPFCYARRRVYDPYFTLLWACYGTYDPFRVEDGRQYPCLPIVKAKLVEFCVREDYPRAEAKLKKLVPSLAKARRAEVREVENLGGYVCQTIEP